MARAKHTARAEARRRHRQQAAEAVTADTELDAEGDESTGSEERRSSGRPARQADIKPEKRDPNARLGFGAAFREAYRPAKLREDLVLLPKLLTTRAFVAATLLGFAGAALLVAFPGYDGSAFAFELLVWPGAAIAPQLVAGFFAPRASYLLGFGVGLIQGVIFTTILTTLGDRLGAAVPPEQMSNLLFLGFVSGPFGGMLFAASAAWYRRFLALTSRRPASRTSSRSTSQRRSARR
ncbi:MAG: hypothetical protein FIA92_12450 [Chloroflexi bacterium]|nr:hypothetical protein [Chloroflexota bacterium]